MAEERDRSKKELKKLVAYDYERKGISEKTLRIMIDRLWPNNFSTRTSGFAIAGSPDAEILWDDATRTFTIVPLDPEVEGYTPDFAIYAYTNKPIYLVRENSESVQIPNEEGNYLFYYTSNETTRNQFLTYIKNPTEDEKWEIYLRKIPVAWLYWNYTSQTRIYFGDSRHGSEFNPQMHWMWHQTLNSVRQEGIGIVDAVVDGDGSSVEHYQFGISAGKAWHEDILAGFDAVGKTESLPVWYLDGGLPRFATEPGRKFLNAGRVAFNGNGINQAADNSFVIYHLFATNCRLHPHISVMGSGNYDSIGAAISAIPAEVATKRQQMPHSNMMWVNSVVIHTFSEFTNPAQARVVYLAGDLDVFVTGTDFDPETGILTLYRSANMPPLTQFLDLSDIIHEQIIEEGDTIKDIVYEGDTINTGDGTTTEITLNTKPHEYTVRVYLNGVRQHPNDYTVADKTVTFNDPPWAGDKIQIFYEPFYPSQEIGGEVPAGAIDGSNKNFTLTETPDPASVNVYLNGILQASSAYVINGNVVTLDEAPYTGDYIIIDYKTDTAPANAGYNQSPTGLVDGSNTVYTLPVSPTKVMVYLNGVRQLEDTHFTHAGDTITFSQAPYSGDWIIVDYEL